MIAPSICRELCRRAAVGFVQARISGLDVQSRELRLEGERPALRFDWLSLNLGATVHCPDQAGCLPIKPLEPVLKALAKLSPGDRVRVIGSGAAAVEVSLALAARGLMVQLVARERQRSFGAVLKPCCGRFRSRSCRSLRAQ